MSEKRNGVLRLPSVATSTQKKKKKETAESELRTQLSQYGKILDYADRQYESGAEALDAERLRGIRRAAVDRVLHERYSPVSAAGASLTGLGVRSSADADAANEYRRAVGEAERNYTEGLTKLGDTREKSRVSLMKYYGELLQDDQNKLYERTLKRITDEDWYGHEGLRRLLDNVRAHLRDEQMAHLDNVASYYFANKGYK